MIETGSIRALPEDLSSFPLLHSLLESVSYTQYMDGRYYAIPRASFMDSILGATDAAMLVRRDWMDNLGLKDPENLEEFAAMCSAFAHEDPDGNGLDDTIGYNVNNLSALGKWVIIPGLQKTAVLSPPGQRKASRMWSPHTAGSMRPAGWILNFIPKLPIQLWRILLPEGWAPWNISPLRPP